MSAIASPLPKLYRHPLKWFHNKVHNLGLSLLLGHIGVLAVVGLYYVLFQTITPVTWHWNHLLTKDIHVLSTPEWTYWRHLLRNVGEGLFGVMLAQQIVFNPFKLKLKKAKAFDRLELKLRIPNIHQKHRVSAQQLICAPLVALVYAIPGFILGALVALGVRHMFHTEHVHALLTSHPSFAQKLYAESWDQKLVGFIAGVFMARRPMKKVFADVQLFFAERRVALHKRLRFYHPPAYKALVRQLKQEGQLKALRSQARHTTLVKTLMLGSMLLIIGFGAFGYYVLQYIA